MAVPICFVPAYRAPQMKDSKAISKALDDAHHAHMVALEETYRRLVFVSPQRSESVPTTVPEPNLSIILPGGCNAHCPFCFWKRDTELPRGPYAEALTRVLSSLPPQFLSLIHI